MTEPPRRQERQGARLLREREKQITFLSLRLIGNFLYAGALGVLAVEPSYKHDNAFRATNANALCDKATFRPSLTPRSQTSPKDSRSRRNHFS
jgi:hypothetical protein